MNNKILLAKLNFFYSLEINQVQLYLKQSKKAEDPHFALALKKFAEIEQGHVENVRNLIEKLGEMPKLIGEVAGSVTGKMAGGLINITSPERTIQINIALENKAISDYKRLIKKIKDPEIRDVLWSNMIDEELHASWFIQKLNQIKIKT